MKYPIPKILFFLVILFLLDLLKPLGYALSVDFLFLGIVYTALNYYFSWLLFISIIFGYFKDVFTQTGISLSILEYSLISFFIYNLRANFLFIDKKIEDFSIKVIIAIFLFTLHFIINQKSIELLLSLFFIGYLVQSVLIYIFLTYFFKKACISKLG